MKSTGMINIKDILRHRHDLGLPRAQIAAATGVSAGTVSHVLDRAEAAGLSWPLPADLDDDALRARLYPPPVRDSGHVQPDWDAVIGALKAPRKRRRARLTRRQLWVEYRDEALARGGAVYSYSQFCVRLRARMKDRAGPAQMRFDYAPGLYGLSDFSGKTLALRTGRGEKDVEIFVAILAHSCLIYAEAVPDQRVHHWTMAHRRALEYFGGVPERWIIDNLKAGVNKPDREEPQLNPSFREFAQHYNVAVLPARSGRATDKGMVEAAVGAVQTRILLALRHETFFSLDTMNAAIRRELERLNLAPMACGESRRALFEANERASLQPLPRSPWEWGEWVPRKVGPNGHVRVERNYYSVPDGNVGRGVAARIGERMVEVFLEEGGERIAVHPRKNGRNQYASVRSCADTRPRSFINALSLLRRSRTATMVAAQPASRSGIRPMTRARTLWTRRSRRRTQCIAPGSSIASRRRLFAAASRLRAPSAATTTASSSSSVPGSRAARQSGRRLNGVFRA